MTHWLIYITAGQRAFAILNAPCRCSTVTGPSGGHNTASTSKRILDIFERIAGSQLFSRTGVVNVAENGQLHDRVPRAAYYGRLGWGEKYLSRSGTPQHRITAVKISVPPDKSKS